MTRRIASLVGVGLVSVMVGCHCTRGKCDCDLESPCCPPWNHPAVAAPAPALAPAAVVPVPTVAPAPMPATAPAPIKVEPIKEAPKPDK